MYVEAESQEYSVPSGTDNWFQVTFPSVIAWYVARNMSGSTFECTT